MRLALLLLPLLLLATSCSVAERQTTSVGGTYSQEFSRWFFESLGVRFEVNGLRDALIPANEERLAQQTLQALARRMTRLNDGIRDAKPPEGWESYHHEIRVALDEYESAVADIREGSAVDSLRQQIARLGEAEDRLRTRVTECYGQATTCR